MDGNLRGVLVEPTHLGREVDCTVTQGLKQRGLQLHAMHHDQLVRVPRLQLVDRHIQKEPVSPIAKMQLAHRKAWRIFDTKGRERLLPVRPKCHSGAHLGRMGGTLEDLHFVPCPGQPDGGGKAADAASRDENLHCFAKTRAGLATPCPVRCPREALLATFLTCAEPWQ
jgi:hypothetical protein